MLATPRRPFGPTPKKAMSTERATLVLPPGFAGAARSRPDRNEAPPQDPRGRQLAGAGESPDINLCPVRRTVRPLGFPKGTLAARDSHRIEAHA